MLLFESLREFLLNERIVGDDVRQSLQPLDCFVKTPQTAKCLCRPQVTQMQVRIEFSSALGIRQAAGKVARLHGKGSQSRVRQSILRVELQRAGQVRLRFLELSAVNQNAGDPVERIDRSRIK